MAPGQLGVRRMASKYQMNKISDIKFNCSLHLNMTLNMIGQKPQLGSVCGLDYGLRITHECFCFDPRSDLN